MAAETPDNTAAFRTVVMCGERGKLGVSWLRYQVGKGGKAI